MHRHLMAKVKNPGFKGASAAAILERPGRFEVGVNFEQLARVVFHFFPLSCGYVHLENQMF